jgi:hypothetical protein
VTKLKTFSRPKLPVSSFPQPAILSLERPASYPIPLPLPYRPMSAYTHARTASDVHTQELLGLPEQNANPPPSPSIEGNFFGGSSDRAKGVVWERKMGPAETSYYLPSRADGVNDMYVLLREENGCLVRSTRLAVLLFFPSIPAG